MPSSGASPFLTATWRDLCIASFRVDDAVLESRISPPLELDRWRGSAHVSLVAFDFAQTRLRGVPLPGYRRFPELNLRFYVTRILPSGQRRRGVVFVREFVPKRAVAFVARHAYNEPYVAAPMARSVSEEGQTRTARYTIRRAGAEHAIEVAGSREPSTVSPDSQEHFFKEHQWGYGVDRAGRLLEYEVRHPIWQVYPLRSASIDIDWGVLYGPEWAFLNDRHPDSVVFAQGSPVSVHAPERI